MTGKNIQVVILCGGRGTRLREETEYKPKPLVEIGRKPILWHIMKGYSHYGFNNFILCLGYKGDAIKEYFLNYEYMRNDFMLNIKSKEYRQLNSSTATEDWNIIFADTGKDTNTGGRIKRIEKYIDNDIFFATYGDGISDIDMKKLLAFHIRHNKIATITGFHPRSKYGQFRMAKNGNIISFQEKPKLKDFINGGFFVFDKEFFNYLDEDCVLEREPFVKIVEDKQMVLYNHEGFWFAVDTYKDYLEINDIYNKNIKSWMVWEK